MKKYEKIKRVGHDQNQGMFQNPDDQLLIKEKLDGANFRWTYNHDGQPVFGSKNVEYKIEGKPDYSENVDGRFTNAIQHIRNNVDIEKSNILDRPSRYTFFGENMVSHSLEYKWDETPQVIGFDIYDHKKDKFREQEFVDAVFGELGVTTAPVTMSMTVEGFREAHGSEDGFPIPESEYRDGKGEGVVIINRDMEENDRSGFNTRAKLVTEEFKEKHKEATGANQSVEAVDDHEKAVSKFCTDARIRKHINKMQNHGRELGMEMMENSGDHDGLPIRVAKDIVEEEYDSFVTSNWRLDFKDFRSLVAKRCVHVLKQEVQKLDDS